MSPPNDKLEKLRLYIQELYKTQKTLQDLFQLPFTLDGKIVGDIGEAIVMQTFGLSRHPENTKTHDLRSPDQRMNIQVKTTQNKGRSHTVGMGWTTEIPDHLFVLEINRDGSYVVVFDGPGTHIKKFRQEHPKRKSLDMSTNHLRDLNSKVRETERLSARLQAS
jgi:hypothetical protein